MSILLVEVAPNEVLVDEQLFPNQMKDTYIYEHLRHYCSKFYPLPAIKIKVSLASVVVTQGHHYLFIAKDLGHTSVRAIIDNSSEEEAVRRFLKKSNVTQLDWRKVREEENESLYKYGWHVFFFTRPLEAPEQDMFKEKIVDFFEQLDVPSSYLTGKSKVQHLNFIDSERCAEFQALMPVGDERWYSNFIALMQEFNRKHVPIVSYQGRLFSNGS